MDKRHDSKVDNWLLMLVVSAAVFVLLAATLLSLVGLAFVGLILLLSGAVLPMWIVMATRYYIVEDELRVRAGPLRWNIPLQDIVSVAACHNAALAPAMSKQRLALRYRSHVHSAVGGLKKLTAHKVGSTEGKGRATEPSLVEREFTLLISPEDRYQFILDLGIAEPEFTDDDLTEQDEL